MLSLLGLFNAEVFAMDPLLYMHLPEDRRTASPDRVRARTADALPSSRLLKINMNPPEFSLCEGLSLRVPYTQNRFNSYNTLYLSEITTLFRVYPRLIPD